MSTDIHLPEEEQKTIPAVTRRRRTVRHWPDEIKRRIVEETLQPGASVSVVARRHDVNSNLVFCWRKLYEHGRLGKSRSDQRFIPVGVIGNQGNMAAPTPRSAGQIELERPRSSMPNVAERPEIRLPT
jgi:transposase